ncbi:MAG: AAA family ATPase [Pseudomonadota bacterium]
MYTSFFGLNEKPFSITPDPRYLFMSERHGEALAHLVYGVTESGGFIQLTGEVGTGKTTLVRTLLLNRMPENADVAVVLNPQLSALEFLATICEELGISASDPGSSKALIDALNRHLLTAHADGRRTILVVDEAQNLARDVLEQVRLLTNLETSKQKLLQIILIGQPELRELLARNDLRQLAQRITGRYHLEPLSREETATYIEHRLKVAGALGEVFEPAAKREVFRLSEGVPRLINVICDRALLGAYASESRRVGKTLVRRANREIYGGGIPQSVPRWLLPAVGIAAVAALAAGGWQLYGERFFAPLQTPSPVAETQAQPTPPPAANTAVGALPDTGVAEIPPAESGSAAPPDETLDEQLGLAGEYTYAENAYATLFALWGKELDGNGSEPCRQAAAHGLACHAQRGTWASLRQLDRPAILTLTDSGGDSHAVVLTALNGDIAELSIAGVSVAHPVGDVAELWFGRFELLWKPATASAEALVPGADRPGVAWLRQGLADIDERYRSEPVDSTRYDAELTERVREFQRDQRISVDGLAGKQTQIIMNSLLATDDRPRLVTARLASDNSHSGNRP